MISARGLTKTYGDVHAVDDLTFEVAAGKVTGLLGPNGAGKSTAMRVVMGLDGATAGTATVGLLLRSTAGGLVTVIALVLVLPPLLANLPRDDMTTTSSRITLATWALAALLAGGWRLRRTDANR